MVVHDYQAICPRINLAGESGLYCGEPDEAGCDSCLTTQGNRSGLRSIRAWREVNAQLFAAADRLLVPNADVSERLARYFPQAVFHVSPHEQILPGELQMRNPVIKPQEPLHVVVVGAIGKVKGYDVLLECARNARQRALPLRFSVLGYSMDDQKLRQAGVSITGRYLEREGPAKLEALEPHVVWLPSLWPETYSYTLSMALNGGYQVFAFDIGAIGRRLRELAMDDNLMALETSRDIARIADTFVAFRDMKIGNVRGIAPGEVIVSAR
jgi:glycosyltransferase involved in cell wall biosynthesis